MNGYSSEGNWGRFKAMAKAGWDTFTGADIRAIDLQISALKERWAKLTDDRLDTISGTRFEFARNIEETDGTRQNETEQQLFGNGLRSIDDLPRLHLNPGALQAAEHWAEGRAGIPYKVDHGCDSFCQGRQGR